MPYINRKIIIIVCNLSCILLFCLCLWLVLSVTGCLTVRVCAATSNVVMPRRPATAMDQVIKEPVAIRPKPLPTTSPTGISDPVRAVPRSLAVFGGYCCNEIVGKSLSSSVRTSFFSFRCSNTSLHYICHLLSPLKFTFHFSFWSEQSLVESYWSDV